MINLTDKEWNQAQIEAEVEDALIAYSTARIADVTTVGTQVTAVAAQNTAIAAQVTVVDGVADLIPASTGTLSWNATALAAIELQCNDALVAEGLDHLTTVADATLATVINDTVIAHILAVDGDVSDFDDNTDSLEAIRDKADLIQPDAADNLSTAMTELEAVLDLARAGDSGDYVMDGSEITLYEELDTTAFMFEGGFIDWTGLQSGAGVDTTIKGYAKIEDGGAWVQNYEETFLNAALPSPLLVPVPRNTTTDCAPAKFANTYGVKITATQAAVGGGWNTLAFEAYDSKAGG